MKRLDIIEELCAAIEQDRRPVGRLAEAAGVNSATISRWLSGEVRDPRAETLHKVAKALGRRLAWVDDEMVLVGPASEAPKLVGHGRWRPHLWVRH
jgi:transcriptional regulator with XRE-family HTH domain